MSNEERRLNRSDRLFRMILLLQGRPNLSSKDLADHFDVSRRTIFRDLRALTDSGVPLTWDESGGYEILDTYQLRPLMLTAREASTLLVGISFMKLQPDASLRADADDVGLKIRAILPDDVREFIDRMLSHTILDPYWSAMISERDSDEGRWYRIGEAISRRKRILIEYRVPSRDEVTRRQVDPLGLVYYTDHWNLVGFDHLRSDVRNFRLERIEKLIVLNESFTPPADFDLQSYLLHDRGATQMFDFEIAFRGEAIDRARRWLPAVLERETVVDGWTHFYFRFENVEYVAKSLIRFGNDARAISPPALLDGVATALRETLALYESAL